MAFWVQQAICKVLTIDIYALPILNWSVGYALEPLWNNVAQDIISLMDELFLKNVTLFGAGALV